MKILLFETTVMLGDYFFCKLLYEKSPHSGVSPLTRRREGTIYLLTTCKVMALILNREYFKEERIK